MLAFLGYLGLYAQQLTYEFSYDQAGNRICRTIVNLRNDKGDNTMEEATTMLEDRRPDGTLLLVYPNPTAGTVRIEASEGKGIKSYRVSDANGREIYHGAEAGSSVFLDLSGHPSGIYLLEVLIKDKPYVYKIIKQ